MSERYLKHSQSIEEQNQGNISFDEWKKSHSQEEVRDIEDFIILMSPTLHQAMDETLRCEENAATVENDNIDELIELISQSYDLFDVEAFFDQISTCESYSLSLSVSQDVLEEVKGIVEYENNYNFNDFLVSYCAKIVQLSGLPFDVHAYTDVTSHISYCALNRCWSESLIKNGDYPDIETAQEKFEDERLEEIKEFADKTEKDRLKDIELQHTTFDLYINSYLKRAVDITLYECGLDLDCALSILLKKIYYTRSIPFCVKAFNDTFVKIIAMYRQKIRDAGIFLEENGWDRVDDFDGIEKYYEKECVGGIFR